jgi:energy-coupling factor transporter ATP-binding protein EcfA2
LRLHAVNASAVPPITAFSVSDLSDVIVLAGPNGVGKTRLAQAIIGAFRDPTGTRNIRLVVQPTSEVERNEWKLPQLDTSVAAEAQLLAQTIQRQHKRTQWTSSVFQFESDRANLPYHPWSFSFDVVDPWDEMVGWDSPLSGFRNRFQDTISSLFRKVHSRRGAIATKGEELIRAGGGTIDPLDFPDPIQPFKEAFRQLLAPKELVDPDPKEQALFYNFQGQRFSINALSSGEREVVNIAFDFLLRNPTDSVILFDEPELHLHPELSYKLLHTLRNAGIRNQFIFVTHSPDIITASLEHSVVFIAPPRADSSNQAVVVHEDDATHEALRLIGQSIGIVSLGKRIVLIEGANTSLDKQTYGAILKNKFPGIVLVPSGGRGLIRSFAAVLASVLHRTLWGVEFFMLCDRDALPPSADAATLQTQAGERLRVLGRYHLENYFLDESVLASVFKEMEPDGSWLRNPASIRDRLKEIAAEMIPYATALIVAAQQRERFGNIDLMAKGCHGKTADQLVALVLDRVSAETARCASVVNAIGVEAELRRVHSELTASLADGRWKTLVPGKPILEKFATAAGLQSGRLKIRYLAEAERAPQNPFAEVLTIFEGFAKG